MNLDSFFHLMEDPGILRYALNKKGLLEKLTVTVQGTSHRPARISGAFNKNSLIVKQLRDATTGLRQEQREIDVEIMKDRRLKVVVGLITYWTDDEGKQWFLIPNQ